MARAKLVKKSLVYKQRRSQLQNLPWRNFVRFRKNLKPELAPTPKNFLGKYFGLCKNYFVARIIQMFLCGKFFQNVEELLLSISIVRCWPRYRREEKRVSGKEPARFSILMKPLKRLLLKKFHNIRNNFDEQGLESSFRELKLPLVLLKNEISYSKYVKKLKSSKMP